MKKFFFLIFSNQIDRFLFYFLKICNLLFAIASTSFEILRKWINAGRCPVVMRDERIEKKKKKGSINFF